MQLQRNNAIPLYQQLLNAIRLRIASGEWPVGSQLPTEVELAAELGVSRVTVRQALGAAVNAGLVVRTPGKGTYVAEAKNVARSGRFIGHVVPHLSHTFNVQMLLGVESFLKAEGYQLIFCTSEGDLLQEQQLLQRLEVDGMAGYIVEAVHGPSAHRLLCDSIAKKYPLVLLDRSLDGVNIDLVASDHFGGGYAIVRHLIEQGYTDIVYVAREPLQLSSIVERIRGYQAAMTDAALSAHPPFVIKDTIERGFLGNPSDYAQYEAAVVQIIADLLRSPSRPEAIVAMNDLMALLVMEAARQAGLHIPHDLAVVGFDDVDFAATRNPPLTTVAQPSFQLGVEAARLLLARLRGEVSTVRQIRLPTQVVARKSSSPRRAVRRAAALR